MAKCKVSGECGGCEYIGRPYEYQLGVKQARVKKLFEGICDVGNIIPCDRPYYYRNKVHVAFKRGRGGKIIYGTYAKGSHRIIEHDKCLIENKKAQEIINTIAVLASKHRLSIYDERSGNGLLRRVLVRISEATGQIMVVIVIGSKYFTGKNAFIDALLKAHPEITTVVTNLNTRHDSMILGGPCRTEFGKGYIEDIILGKKFRISPESFFQVNTAQAELLYAAALELAGIDTDTTVLDCYCGTGTITICAACICRDAIGVEINSKAVEDAVKNAKINGVKNVSFIKADATRYMKDLASSGDAKPDVVIMDPPRSGSTKEFIESCAKLDPDRVVYISCNPDTLVRDVKDFIKCGYKPVKVIPADMFPWSEDVETICLLTQ